MSALKRAIHEQTLLHPQHMELYHENIPFKPIKPIKTSQLPVTTVSLHSSVLASHTLTEWC